MPDAATSSSQANGANGRGLRESLRKFFPLRPADVLFYRFCDSASGILIGLMVLFGPWAFGTTQPWSIWTMNVAGYVLGALLLAKIFIREVKGYPALRWDVALAGHRPYRRAHRLTVWLAWLTLMFLLYCLIGTLNAAAVYDSAAQTFNYRSCIKWLPHSLDAAMSWATFWKYLGLAASFWAVRDWLLGLTPEEERLRAGAAKEDAAKFSTRLPARLRRLFWLLCLNGAVLGIEAIIQRACGSDKLLFLVQPRVNKWTENQFGPYAYRSNAAQYFNLLWPVCLGFWWTLRRRAGSGSRWQHLLLAGAAVMAACPVISSSRASAVTAAGMAVFALVFFVVMGLAAKSRGERNHASRGIAIGLAFFFCGAAALGWYYGWDALWARLEQLPANYTPRGDMYVMAAPMAADYPVYGTGPGTFATVFQLYRISNDTYWPEQLHNDWLELRITLGWVGFLMLLAALALAAGRWFLRGGIYGGARLVIFVWLALAGCLAQARYDFPFQVHSIVFLFLVLCAMLASLTRQRR